MTRVRELNRIRAFEMYKEHSGDIKNREIASMLQEDEKKIAVWKKRDRWEDRLNEILEENKKSGPNKKGGQPKNKNAVGNKGGAPKRNMNSLKHGAYSKYLALSEEELEIISWLEEQTTQELMMYEYKNLVIKEHRLTKDIVVEQENVKGLSIKDVTTRKRVFDEGEQNETITHVSSVFERIMKLEGELTKVRSQKMKCINSMHKIDMDTKRVQIETAKLMLEVGKVRGEGAPNPIAEAVKKMRVRRDKE